MIGLHVPGMNVNIFRRKYRGFLVCANPGTNPDLSTDLYFKYTNYRFQSERDAVCFDIPPVCKGITADIRVVRSTIKGRHSALKKGSALQVQYKLNTTK